MVAALLWIAMIIPGSSGTFSDSCNSRAGLQLLRFQLFCSLTWKKCEIQSCEHYTGDEKWNPHARWKLYTVITVITGCVCVCVCTLERKRERVLLAGFCVIHITDSGPVIVSSTAGSEASLSYWPLSDSHWVKTRGWWHRSWEHVNFAL